MKFGDIKSGCLLVIKYRVCKVIDVRFCKSCRHGGAKKLVTGIDLITDKTYTETFTPLSRFCPFVAKTVKYNTIHVEEYRTAVMLNEEGEEIRQYKIPDNEFGEKIKLYVGKGEDVVVHVLIVQVADREPEYRVTDMEMAM